MWCSQPAVELDEEQVAGVQPIYERLQGVFDEERKSTARFIASKPNHQLFLQTEFKLRDRVHELGDRVLETAAGAWLARLLEEQVTFGQQKSWAWQRDARERSCAYVSLDATSVRQPGENGAQAEGRMAYVGMLYHPHNPRSAHDERRPEPHQVWFFAGLYPVG